MEPIRIIDATEFLELLEEYKIPVVITKKYFNKVIIPCANF